MSHNNAAVPDAGEAVRWDDGLIRVDTVVPWTYQAGGIGWTEAPGWKVFSYGVRRRGAGT